MPYRKPLSVVVDHSRHKQQYAPSSLGLQSLPDTPLVLGSLLLLDRHPPAGLGEVPPASVTEVPLCEALAERDASGKLGAMFAGEAKLSDAQKTAVTSEEGWILGI